MPITADAAFAQEIAGTVIHRELQVTLTLPVLGALDATLNVKSLTYGDQDTSNYPDQLTVKAGDTDLSGTLVLAGKTGSGDDVVALLDADNPASRLYQLDTLEGTLVVKEGVNAGGVPDLVTVTVAYVTTISADVLGGTVTIEFTDVPDGFDDLPDGLSAVLTPPPWNAGLTNEYVYDRIARAASGGLISSWPAIRPKCVLAMSGRTSISPEIGTLQTGSEQPTPVFGTGPYGSGLIDLTTAPETYTTAQWALASPVRDDALVEFLVSEIFSSGRTMTVVVTEPTLLTALEVDVTATGVTVQSFTASGGYGSHVFAYSFNDQPHKIDVAFHQALGSASFTATVYVDGAQIGTYSGTTTQTRAVAYTMAYVNPDANDSLAPPSSAIAGLQVTTETSPTVQAFTPLLSCDPSLNVLQAVPAIDKGSNAWDELQTAAESECGWIGWRAGVLTFRNRLTIATQVPWKTITAEHDLETLSKQSTSNATFNDVAMDFTEWQFSDPSKGQGFVYSPVKVLRFPAKRTVTFERDLPNGITAGSIDQTIGYFTSSTAKPAADGNSVWQLSADRNGLNEHPNPGNVEGTVAAVTPSRIRITVTNHSTTDAFAASPAKYVNPNFGTGDVSLWVGGVKASPDQATTLHGGVGGAPSFAAPSNQYNQDRDSTQATADFLAAQLFSPKTTYTNVAVVPNPRYQVTDRVTLNVPTGSDGAYTPLDVFIWARDVTIDFDGGTYDMTPDVRAVAAPGEWVLGTSVLGASTFIY